MLLFFVHVFYYLVMALVGYLTGYMTGVTYTQHKFFKIHKAFFHLLEARQQSLDKEKK